MLQDHIFSSIFGSVTGPDGCVQVALAAIRHGMTIVPLGRGSRKPLCTLTAVQAKRADTDARAAALAEHPDRPVNNVRHACGTAHALSAAPGDTRAITRAKTILDRLVKRDGQINIGCMPGRSGYVVVDLDTPEQTESFHRWWSRYVGSDVPALTVRTPGTSDGRHHDGGHVWCQLNGHRPPADARAIWTHPDGWTVIGDSNLVVPPSVRSTGPYVVTGHPVACPDVLLSVLDKPRHAVTAGDTRFDAVPKTVPNCAQNTGHTLPDHTESQVQNYVLESPVSKRLAEHISAVKHAPDGQGNVIINKRSFCVGQYVGAGQLPAEPTLAALTAALDDWEWAEPGDKRRCLRTLHRAFQAGQSQPRQWDPDDPLAELDLFDPESPVPAQTDAAATGAGWVPEDITDVLDGTYEPVQPAIGHRTDGQPLLYPGKEHAIAGEPESGKTWFALAIIKDVLARGGRAVMIDFEDDKTTVVGRLLMIGTPVEHLRPDRFRYVRPDSKLVKGDIERLMTWPDGGTATVAVLDGWTEGAGLVGADVMSQDDIASWRRHVIRPMLDLGAATLTTDHVVKDPAARGRYGIGAQHKLAGLTGVMYLAETVDTWGPGRTGKTRIIVSKDRLGQVRAASRRAGNRANIDIAAYLIGASSDGQLAVCIDPPDPAVEVITVAATDDVSGRVLDAIRDAGGRIGSLRQLRKAVGTHHAALDDAVAELSGMGVITVVDRGPKKSREYLITESVNITDSNHTNCAQRFDLEDCKGSSRPGLCPSGPGL